MNSDNRELPSLYRDVDQQTDDRQMTMIAMLDYQNALPAMIEAKRTMLDFARPESGDIVLDAGCGLGDDTRDLARIVGPTGLVVGIDNSEAMIEIARQRSTEAATSEEFIIGDVHAVDFSDNTFDIIRSERTLQWLTEPERWLDEMLRVLKPGGRFVVCDTDYGTSVMAFGDPEQLDLLVESHIRRVPSPREARMIPKRFRDRALTDISVGAVTNVGDTDAHQALKAAGVDIIHEMHRSGVLADVQYEQMVAEERAALETNSAYTFATMIIAAGTKPA